MNESIWALLAVLAVVIIRNVDWRNGDVREFLAVLFGGIALLIFVTPVEVFQRIFG